MKANGLCKDCKWWSGEWHLHMRTCECPKMEFGYGSRYDKEKLDIDSVLIEDDEGWGWFTGPKFGCVHFKEKG